MQFEPFQDRLSRDIRNDLSSTMGKMLELRDISPARKVAAGYLGRQIEASHRGYITERLERYRAALAVIETGPADRFWQALVLWDHGLFFEVHEVLEQLWLKAAGPKKMVLQAMIRAAGVYIKREYGYMEAAGKIAERALPVLAENREFLAEYFDPNLLLHALGDVAAPPPRLLRPAT